MSESSKLRQLYRAIPDFSCKPGCSGCCGPVPISEVEWKVIKIAKRVIQSSDIDCEYLLGSKCSIYRDRPFLCRLFGASVEAKMRCPHGYGPNVPLTEKQTAVLAAKYFKLIGNSPAAFTAEVKIGVDLPIAETRHNGGMA